MANNDSHSVAIFNHSLETGGSERVTINIAEGLLERGHDVDIVLVWKQGGFLEKAPSDADVIGLDTPHIPGFGVSAAIPAFRNYLKSEGPDSVLSVGNHNNVVAWAATRRLSSRPQLVVSEHLTLSPKTNNRFVKYKNILITAMTKYMYDDTDAVVTVSGGTADDLHNRVGIPRAEISVIHNPIVTDRLKEMATKEISHPWLNDDIPVVVSLGRLAPRKDPRTLIKAVSLIRENQNIRLLIMGDGPLRKELRDFIEEEGYEDFVSLQGFVDNPYNCIANSSVFVLSSTQEGFGNVLVEAMACGCPVVATDCPSGPAEILQHGKYGRLVPVQDPEKMATAIIEELNEPTSKMELYQRSNHFTSKTIAKEYEKVLFE